MKELIGTMESKINQNKMLTQQIHKTRNSRAKSAKFRLKKGDERLSLPRIIIY